MLQRTIDQKNQHVELLENEIQVQVGWSTIILKVRKRIV